MENSSQDILQKQLLSHTTAEKKKLLIIKSNEINIH